jgi:hypothetical protein
MREMSTRIATVEEDEEEDDEDKIGKGTISVSVAERAERSLE